MHIIQLKVSMLQICIDKITNILGERFSYFKFLVKSVIAFSAIFIFYFLKPIIPVELESYKNSISFIITIFMVTLYFINEEKRFNFKFLQYFNTSFMKTRKYQEMVRFKEKLYFQNIKKIIGKIFHDLKVKVGYFVLVGKDEYSFFSYQKDKVSFIEQKLQFSYVVEFLNQNPSFFYLIDRKNEEMYSFLQTLNSDCILSLKFKNQLIGFLCFQKTKKQKLHEAVYTKMQEKSILFYNLMINRYGYKADKFKNEMKRARLSSKFLKEINIPKLKDIRIELLEVSDELLEFYKNKEDVFYFVLAAFECSPQTKNLMMSYISGLSFSLQYQSSKEIFKIKDAIRENFQDVNWKEKESIVIGRFELNSKNMEICTLGEKIKVSEIESNLKSPSSHERTWTFGVENRKIVSIHQSL